MADSIELDDRLGRRLDGWKEIANFLGRGVRTAQRWEKDYGLPVRRHGQGKSEAVFAFEKEVAEWLVTSAADNAKADENGGDTADAASSAAPAAPSPTVFPGSPPRPTRRPAWVLPLVIVATILVVALAWRQFGGRVTRSDAPSATGVPSSYRFDLDALVILDESGHALWRQSFSRPIRQDAYRGLYLNEKIRIADIDKDGKREILFVPQLKDSVQFAALHCFNADRTIRWTYEHTGSVKFGQEEYAGPFPIEGFFVTPAPEDPGKEALWVVSVHNAMFPSLLQRLDVRTGRPISTYWSNGYITAIEVVRREGHPRLYVGASNNETRGTSLAELDALDANGSAPASVEKYRCTSCPAGTPRTFIVFPKPRRFDTQDTCGSVLRMDPQDRGKILVRVIHALNPLNPNDPAVAIYKFPPSLEPEGVDVSDGYMATYHALAGQSIVRKGVPMTSMDDEFLPLLKWNGAGFSPLPKLAPVK